MIKNDWSPVPKDFGTIGDVKDYCEAYILKNIFKVNPLFIKQQEKMSPDVNDMQVSDEVFSIMCADTVEPKSSLLLLKAARGQMLSKLEMNYLCYAVPAYVDNSVLLSIRPDYPLYYAMNEKVTYKEPVGNYENKSVNGVNYRSKPSEDRIRHFRLEEITQLTDIIGILGVANDHRYTEIEICGIIMWVYLSEPENYYFKIFKNLLEIAKHGLHLRALLKPYSVSVKRWPSYWLNYLEKIEPYLEVETILGFIIVEKITDDMLEDLDTALDIAPMNYYTDGLQFMKDITNILDGWVNVTSKPIKDLTLEEFFTQWDLWTTSGAASDIRVSVEGSKPKRIHKSAIPLFLTVDELYKGRLQPSRTSVKAETGKGRLVFSAPTYDSLVASYLLYKYDTYVQNSNLDDFFSFSQEYALNTSADIIDKLSSSVNVGSSDIEHNDWLHNVTFDCYVFVTLIERVILAEDIPILLDLCSRSVYNWVFIPGVKFNSRHLQFKNDKGTHIMSTGGLITGQRRTTLYNGFYNRIGNDLARLLVKRTVGKSPGARNLFGGDDSIQTFDSHSLGALTYIASTSILLTISPLKSFISSSSAEYFRVGYSKKGRQGYSNRVIHSIISNNPASLQEIDVVLKCKSLYDTLQIFARRSGTNKISRVFEIYYQRLGLTDEMVAIPTSAGGVGIGRPLDKRLVPGIPRYVDNSFYSPESTWFDNMSQYLNPLNLPGVIDSYLIDMSKGVIDRDKVKVKRDRYKDATAFWRGKVKFKNNQGDWNAAMEAFTRNNNMLERVSYFTILTRSFSTYYYDAVKSWQEYTNNFVDRSSSIRIVDKSKTRIISDIINRSEMEKVSDKINLLKDLKLVIFLNGVINKLPGKVLLDLILDKINGNNTTASVPTDMHFYYSIIRSYQQSSKLNYVSQSVLCNLSTEFLYDTLITQYSQLLSW